MSLRETLGNDAWMNENAEAIKKLFPETWTHVENLEPLKMGYGFKLLGIGFRSVDEFGKVMVFLERSSIFHRKGMLIKRSI